jgi:hypothetical protein
LTKYIKKENDLNSRGRGRPPKSLVNPEIIEAPVEAPPKVEPPSSKKQSKREKAMKSPEKVAVKEKLVAKLTAKKGTAVQLKAETIYKKEVLVS